jgi:hypothetical protein
MRSEFKFCGWSKCILQGSDYSPFTSTISVDQNLTEGAHLKLFGPFAVVPFIWPIDFFFDAMNVEVGRTVRKREIAGNKLRLFGSSCQNYKLKLFGSSSQNYNMDYL